MAWGLRSPKTMQRFWNRDRCQAREYLARLRFVAEVLNFGVGAVYSPAEWVSFGGLGLNRSELCHLLPYGGGIPMGMFRLVVLTGFVLACSVGAAAHHGTSPYDTTKLTTVKGTVTDFEFINPHVVITVQATDDKGNTDTWTGEANSPNVLSRHGWDRNVIKKGDQITVIGNRGKNGSKTLRLQKVVLPNGQELDPNSIQD
jgi:hypothetical protein